jgi:hypothetical protein
MLKWPRYYGISWLVLFSPFWTILKIHILQVWKLAKYIWWENCTKRCKKLAWHFIICIVFPFLNYCENSHTMNKYIPHLLREFAVIARINYITIIWEFHPIWESYNPPFTEGECVSKNACIPWLVKIHSDQVPQVLWHSQLFQCN